MQEKKHVFCAVHLAERVRGPSAGVAVHAEAVFTQVSAAGDMRSWAGDSIYADAGVQILQRQHLQL